MKDITCPYCDSEFNLAHDDGEYYDESNREEWECPGCGKISMITSWCLWNHEAEKADCLNGGEHILKKIIGFPEEYFENIRRCSICDKEINYRFRRKSK